MGDDDHHRTRSAPARAPGRAPGLVLLPIGSLGSLGVGVIGLLTPPRRRTGVGLTLGILTIVGLLVLQLRYGS